MKKQNILESLHISLLNVDDCCARNWNYRNVISPFSRIYLVKSGEGFVIHKQKKHHLLPGRLYLISSITLCNYESNTFLEHYYIHLAFGVDSGDRHAVEMFEVRLAPVFGVWVVVGQFGDNGGALILRQITRYTALRQSK